MLAVHRFTISYDYITQHNDMEGKGYPVIRTMKTFAYENTEVTSQMLRLLTKVKSNMYIFVQHNICWTNYTARYTRDPRDIFRQSSPRY